MGDSAALETLTALQDRLATALDRMSAGLGVHATNGIRNPETDEARLEAEARAEEAEERVAALEARLAETQDTLSDSQAELVAAREALAEAEPVMQAPGTDAAALVALEARLAEAVAARGLAVAELAEREAAIAKKDALLAEAQVALEAAEAAAHADAEPSETGIGPDADIATDEKAMAVMGRRLERARTERDAARAACDAANDLADELREASGAEPEARVLELRRQVRLMRVRAEDLAAEMSLLQSGAGVDIAALDQGLRAEVETLRQLRETDAAELDRIVQDMQAGLELEEGADHA